MWPEIEKADTEKRHELTLSGREISARISKDGLDKSLFNLVELNYLNVSNTTLESFPEELGQLKKLQTLVLHSNKLKRVRLSGLEKLKTLDLSRNELENAPEELKELPQLVSVNLSFNKISDVPDLSGHPKLASVELSNNKLRKFPCLGDIENLAELNLSHNEIEDIPESIGTLSALKVLNMSDNKLKVIRGDLVRCGKLKDVNFKDNPIADRHLLKLINQCRTKQILDYIKQQNPTKTVANKNKKGKAQNAERSNSTSEKDDGEYLYTIKVQHCTDDFRIIVKDDVKTVRAHIVGFLIYGLSFTEDTFKKFIQLQSKLHDGICDKRNAATIATHDFKKLASGDVVYTAVVPKELRLQPLNRTESMTGADLFARLQAEANALRKEKKRNVYSGVHRYLYLLEGQSKYPCVLDAAGTVVSFPPITNSEVSKVSLCIGFFLSKLTFSPADFCRNQRDVRRSDELDGNRNSEKSGRHSPQRDRSAFGTGHHRETSEKRRRRWEPKIRLPLEDRFGVRRRPDQDRSGIIIVYRVKYFVFIY